MLSSIHRNMKTIYDLVQKLDFFWLRSFSDPFLMRSKMKSLDFRTFGPLDLWTFGPLDLWTFSPLDLWTFGSSDLRIFGSSDLRIFGSSDLQISQIPRQKDKSVIFVSFLPFLYFCCQSCLLYRAFNIFQ